MACALLRVRRHQRTPVFLHQLCASPVPPIRSTPAAVMPCGMHSAGVADECLWLPMTACQTVCGCVIMLEVAGKSSTTQLLQILGTQDHVDAESVC